MKRAKAYGVGLRHMLALVEHYGTTAYILARVAAYLGEPIAEVVSWYDNGEYALINWALATEKVDAEVDDVRAHPEKYNKAASA